MFDALVDAGFFLEVLGSPLTCFDAMQVCVLFAARPQMVCALVRIVEPSGTAAVRAYSMPHHTTSLDLLVQAQDCGQHRDFTCMGTCVFTPGSQLGNDCAQYGNLLIVDPEEEFYAAEVTKLAADVREHGLGLIVFAEWYNVDIMAKMRFFDDNTRSWWTPITGAAIFSLTTTKP